MEISKYFYWNQQISFSVLAHDVSWLKNCSMTLMRIEIRACAISCYSLEISNTRRILTSLQIFPSFLYDVLYVLILNALNRILQSFYRVAILCQTMCSWMLSWSIWYFNCYFGRKIILGLYLYRITLKSYKFYWWMKNDWMKNAQ